MIRNGLVFGTEMHLATAVVILIEFIFLVHQAFKCLENLRDKQRIRYFWLLFLLLLYNITSGLFPDEKMDIPIFWQCLFCYSGGLAVSAYVPFYFYKSYAVVGLKFHVKRGVWLFLMLPFYLFFIGGYILIGNIDLAINCGMGIPLVYSFVLLFAIGRAIYRQYTNETLANLKEILLMFISIFPWGLMAVMSIVRINQLQELILANVGFLFFRVFYVKEEFRSIRGQEFRIQEMDYDLVKKESHIQALTDALVEKESCIQATNDDLAEKESHIQVLTDSLEEKESHIQEMVYDLTEKDVEILQLRQLLEINKAYESHVELEDSCHFNEVEKITPDDKDSSAVFEQNCKKYLTRVQTEVINLVNEGLTYKEVARKRNNTSDESVKELMGSIRRRLKANSKADILLKLKTPNLTLKTDNKSKL